MARLGGDGSPGEREIKVMAENLVVLSISVMAVGKCPNTGNLREERFILAHSLMAQSIMVGCLGGRSMLEVGLVLCVFRC